MRKMQIDIHRYNLVQITVYSDETSDIVKVHCTFRNKIDTIETSAKQL